MPTNQDEMTRGQLDDIAWRFLRSEFSSPIYADWPIDRRLNAYLLHQGPRRILGSGSAFEALLERVMANIAEAIRLGVLSS